MGGMDGLTVWFFAWSYGAIWSHLLVEGCSAVSPSLRQVSSNLCMLTLLLLPFAPYFIDPQDTVLKGVVAFSTVFYSFRVWQTLVENRFQSETLLLRMAHVGATFHDVQDCKPKLTTWRSRFSKCWFAFLETSLFGLGVVFTQKVLEMHSDQSDVTENYLKFATLCLALGFHIMLSLCALGSSLQIYLALGGLEAPRLMQEPWKSRTVREFWGKRWNSVIQGILANYVYIPLRKKLMWSRAASSLVVFAVSGLIHVWPVLFFNVPIRAAFSVMAFFLSQYAAIALQDLVQVEQWKNQTAKKLFTFVLLALPLPLLAFPFIDILASLSSQVHI